MLVLTLVMWANKLRGDGLSPPALFVYCAMLPWQFFSTALSESGTSLVNNSNLISKVYFPRLVVPASSVVTSFVDFAISAAFTVFLLAWFRFVPPLNLVALPIFVLLTFGVSLGVGLWIAALMVKYRDFRFVVPFVVQFGLYAAPVFAMTSRFPETLKIHALGTDWTIAPRLIYSLNPVVGIIDGFRWCILGGPNVLYWPGQIASVAGVIFLIYTGVWYFRKTERTFADMI